jgi:hypothetical protein
MQAELTYEIELDKSTHLETWGFTIALSEYDEEQSRWTFDWTVTKEGIVLGTSNADWDTKLHGPVVTRSDRPPTLAAMLATLLHYLAAWAEGMEYSERTGTDSKTVNLFGATMVPVLDEFDADTLDLFAQDIDGRE